jgi:vancomycin resistance protein VanJ
MSGIFRIVAYAAQAPFWALLALIAVWHIASRAPATAGHGLVTIGHIAAPWIALMLPVLAVCAWLLRQRPLALGAAAVALPLAATFGPAFVRPSAISAARAQSTLKIIAFNMHGKRPETRHADIAEMLKRENADVIVLQECYHSDFKLLREQLAQIYPHYVKNVENGGSYEQVTFSRWPIERLGAESRHYKLLKARVTTPDGAVQIWSLHSFRMNLLPQTAQGSTDSWRGYADPRKFALSEGQYAWLHREIDQHRTGLEPLILAGDLNMPARSYEYQRLAAKFDEAHARAGFGFGMTYPMPDAANPTSRLPLPIVRIDHVFVDRALTVLGASVGTDAAGSDHAPVVVEVALQ